MSKAFLYVKFHIFLQYVIIISFQQVAGVMMEFLGHSLLKYCGHWKLGRDKGELNSSSLESPKWETLRERMTPKAMQL